MRLEGKRLGVRLTFKPKEVKVLEGDLNFKKLVDNKKIKKDGDSEVNISFFDPQRVMLLRDLIMVTG
jgi:hypothetical protein